jgi:hypothetical protein
MRYSARCAYNLGIRTSNACSVLPCAKNGRIQWRRANITCWLGGTHQRFKPYNRYLSRIGDKEITIGSTTVTATADRYSVGDDLSSRITHFDRKGLTSARRPDHQGRKEIGGGIDEVRERTLCATAAVNPVTSWHSTPTHLPAKRPTRGKHRRVRARR